MQIKEARDGARGPGDLGLRGPERSVDIELSSPGRARKKERYRFGIVLFSSARRGSNPRPPPWQGGAPPLSHSRILYRSKPVSRRYEINCVDIHPQSDECLLCVSQQRLYYMMNAKLSRKFLKFFVKFVI